MMIASRTVPYAHLPFERALQGIRDAGIRYVAFGNPAHNGIDYPDEHNPHTVANIRSLLDKYELEPVMITGTTEFAVGLPLERAKARLETAKALGVTHVMSNGMGDTSRYAEFVDKYKRVAEIAGAMDMTISLKPHGGITATAAMVRKLIDDIGSPFVKASYDPGNVRFYTGNDPLDGFDLISGMLCAFVAKDHKGQQGARNFPLPGDGDVDFVELFRRLGQSGYAGPVMIERVDGDRTSPLEAEEIDERILRSKEQLERLLQQAAKPVT
ncbi:MAG: hypothetical protein K0Q59_3987 [Paenibacillus sp.]|nr:hypothetical protein [Paenibacillus sp.]